MTRFEHYFKRDGNLDKAYKNYRKTIPNGLPISIHRYNTWLTEKYIEKPKPILDEVEHRYLESLLKPFRDRVASITKCKDYIDDKERAFLIIELKSEEEDIFLPYFDAKTMYVGMEDGKEYSYETLIEKNHL